MSNEQMVHHLEDVYYDPDYYIHEDHEEEMWNKADEECEERYAERRLNG